MKNKFFNKYLNNLTLSLSLFAASSGVCYAELVAGSGVVPIKTVLLKFAVSMGSVLVSLIVIFVVLAILKKQYGDKLNNRANTADLYGDTLETPKNINDAVISFIDKNRL
ncbi:MAG: hypothetical protein VZR09_00650 [Candidatus Gastranaerophilaceae bacterium]|nr:hypothetical protein [Candidatus Gastranaerophilaceae bacterium]